MTWTYDQSPYIENATALYSDLLTAYNNGAKYAIVFDYPGNLTYGILTNDHLNALKNFYNYISTNPPNDPNYAQVKTAYVMPPDYGFGFRNAQDSIWGIWSGSSENQTQRTLNQKLLSDVNTLTQQYGTDFDIVFDNPQFNLATESRYDTLVYWNDTQ